MEIKAVIFDLDGTLLNSIEDIADANNMMLEEFGYPINPLRKYVFWIGNGARLLVEASLPLGVSWGFGEPTDGNNDVKMVHSPQEMIDYLMANIKRT